MKLAPLVLRYRDAFEHKYGAAATPAMRQAMEAVLACRTERYGHMQLSCPQCHQVVERFHSCGHRSCPACQHYDTGQWLDRQTQKLLPVDYYMVTFTLPRQLRPLVWSHQQVLYSRVFDCAVSTLKSFALNDRALGGELGMTAVLHTHSRALDFHPHVHLVIPGGCLLRKRRQWKKRRGRYLFNEFNLARVFRARLLEAIVQAGFSLPAGLPAQWNAQCERVGRGLPALQYLSRYLYRGVISEANILKDDGRSVTYQYRDSGGTRHTRTLKGEDFLWRVFLHVLPKGFRRARDYGFLHGNASKTRQLIQLLLQVRVPVPQVRARPSFVCARCQCPMHIIAFIKTGFSSG